MNFFIQHFDFKNPNASLKPLVWIFNAILLLLFFFIFAYILFSLSPYKMDFSLVYEYKNKLISGFFTTLSISIAGLVLSFVFGLILCMLSFSKFIFIKMGVRFFVELIRGTPFLVQILLIYYIFANNIGIENRYISGVYILAIFSSAYICEILRAAILSVNILQFESARALGLREAQIYFYVIFPQALKRCLAPLTGQFANLIKDSSLLSVIAVSELTQNAKEINAYTFSTLEVYIPLAFCYLILTLPVTFMMNYIDKRLN